MELKKRNWGRALHWVEKGLALEPLRDWRNESSYSLAHLKPNILAKLGRKEAALDSTWEDFEKEPCDMAYEHLMEHVPRSQKARWHLRAMQAARQKSQLAQFTDLCVQVREWETFAARIRAATNEDLEALSHYSAEPAARALAK